MLPIQTLSLRLPEPDSLLAAAWARMPAQRRGEVAAWAVGARLQDDCGLPPGQRGGLCAGVPGVMALNARLAELIGTHGPSMESERERVRGVLQHALAW